MIIEHQKQVMRKWKDEIKIKDIYTAAEIINGDEALLKKIKEQEEKLGRELSKKLFASILEMVFEDHFLQYLYDIEDIKMYLPYWRLSEKGTVSEFIKICGEQFEVFKRNVIYLSLQYFISAQPSKIIFKHA
jgi:hypothetical protein